MKKLSWRYQNGVVEACDEVQPVSLAARDIFNAEFKSQFEIASGSLPGRPSEAIPVHFSKFPVELLFNVTKGSGESLAIELVAKATSGVRSRIYDLSQVERGHLVIDDTWYPVTPGAVESAKSVLERIGLVNLGSVGIGVYLKLMTLEDPGLSIESEVASDAAYENNFYPLQSPPETLQATLYPYQEQGYSYLSMLYDEVIGGILADEMGLGKTLQVIALMLSKRNASKSAFLVVAPATLLENWRRELEKFAPILKVYVHQGPQRTGNFRDFFGFDVVVTSYDTVLRDLSMLNMLNWDVIVLDEAQAIKNPEAKRTRFLKQMNRNVGIAVTGTPVENSLIDLWSIMDFCVPGLLGSQSDFESDFSDDSESALLLEPRISPLILRRRVTEVAKDLPERLNITRFIDVSEELAEAYEDLRKQISEEYAANAGLVAIGKLRMLCTSASLLDGYVPALQWKNDYKLQVLVDILKEVYKAGEKAIIFTSYQGMIGILMAEIDRKFSRAFVAYIDGRIPVSKRQTIVDEFTAASGFAALLLNPRAAGTGLNITAANHVIHFNPEWNPALEDQSSARAYRRGQSRPVSIYKLIYSGTVEEVINERLDAKRELSEAAIVGNEGLSDAEYVMQALQISPLHKQRNPG